MENFSDNKSVFSIIEKIIFDKNSQEVGKKMHVWKYENGEDKNKRMYFIK